MNQVICPKCKSTLKEKSDDDLTEAQQNEYTIYYSYVDNTNKAIVSHRINTGPYTTVHCHNCEYDDAHQKFINVNKIFDHAIGILNEHR